MNAGRAPHEAPQGAVAQDGAQLEYRALSAGAVVSLVLGLLSPVTILAATSGLQACLMLSPIPLIGLALGLRSWWAIRQTPEQWTGRRLAAAGAGLSGATLLIAWGLLGHGYATEVPAGYARISYALLKPDDRARRRRMVVPAAALALDGKKVFIRGYMRPTSQRYRLREFSLVHDNHECCLGPLGQVHYYDLIQVRLVGPLRVDYRTQSLGVGGTLRVRPESAQPGSGGTVYALEADHIES